MAECHVCGEQTDDFYLCEDCGEPICQKASCGDGIYCIECLGDDIFLAEIQKSYNEEFTKKIFIPQTIMVESRGVSN